MIITILLLWYLSFGAGYYFGTDARPKCFFLKAAIVVLWPFAKSFLKDATIPDTMKKDSGQPQRAA